MEAPVDGTNATARPRSVGKKLKPATAPPAEFGKQQFDVQKFVDKKLKVASTIRIPSPPEFPNEEAEAHGWSIAVVAKYLKSKLEMPQYVDNFKRHEVDGRKFIALDEEQVGGAIDISNKLHALKIASHAQMLRELVLEKAMINKPSKVLDWNAAHLAACLYYDKSCPTSATYVLKTNLAPYKLKDMVTNDIQKVIAGVDAAESESAMQTLNEIAEIAKGEYALSDEGKRAEQQDGHEVDETNGIAPSGTRKTKKAKTAIQRRRDKERAEMDKTCSDAEDVANKEDGIHSMAYQSAMSSILTGVQDISDNSSAQHRPTSNTTPIASTGATAAQTQSKAPPVLVSTALLPSRGIADLPAISEFADSVTSSDERPKSSAGRPSARVPELDSQKEHATATALPAEAYTKSAERKKFLNKIAKLRKIVSDHREHMEELHEQAKLLQEENAAIRKHQQDLLLEGRESQNLVQALVQDRNTALQELERVVTLLDAQTGQERERAAQELSALAEDTHRAHKEVLTVWKAPNKELTELKQVDFSAPAVAQNPTASTTAQSSGPARRVRDGDSSGSDLDDEILPPRRKDAAATHIAAVAAAATVPASATSTQPAKTVQAATEATTTTKPIAPVAASPLRVETDALSVVTKKDAARPTSAAPAAPKAEPPVDLVRMLDNTADAAHAMWQGILRTYRLPKSHAADAHSDSRILLRYICAPWIKLGNQMLQDAQSPDTPKDVRKALKGLERCARKAVQADTRRAKKLASDAAAHDGTLGSTINTATHKKSVLDGTHALSATAMGRTGFGRKATQSKPGSTAFPDGGQDETDEGGHGAGAGSVHVHRNHRAAGMVFGLALVQRLFNRYGSTDTEDKTQLLFLLNRVSHGDLPITEISRDNLRDFLDSHIGLDLKWDKFDSVCQRLDPDRNGFISTSSVARAFEQLSPLVDKLSPHDATFTVLLLLSIVTDTLSKPKLSIQETLLSLILHNSKSSPSFAKYIQHEQERVELEDTGLGRLYGVDPASPRSGQTASTGDARVAELQLFVSDVLYELSKEFVYKAYAQPDLSAVKLPPSSRKELQRRQRVFQRCKKDFTFLTQHHQETCAAVARALWLYDGASRKRLVPELSQLFITFLRFRRRCLLSRIEEAPTQKESECPESESSGPFDEPAPASSAKGTANDVTPPRTALLGDEFGRTMDRTMDNRTNSQSRLTRQTAEAALQRIDRNLATLTGVYLHDHEADGDGTFSPLKPKVKVPTTFALPEDTTSFEDYETRLSELLGMPLLPCPLHGTHVSTEYCGAFQATQSRVEGVLADVLDHFAFEEGLTRLPAAPPKPLASSQALKELQQSLYQELWQDKTQPEESDEGAFGKDEQTLRATHPRSPAKGEAPPIHVVEEVNGLMHKQRVEQCALYLELLNEKAAHRKRIIRNLMNLWQAAKAAIIDRGKIPKFASEVEIEQKRLLAMPQEDIVAQTKAIQQLLVKEMKEPIGTKVEQLSQRINLLRQGMASQTIPDDDMAIAASLREINALENALLQANADAMRLAGRIIKQLGAKKQVDG